MDLKKIYEGLLKEQEVLTEWRIVNDSDASRALRSRLNAMIHDVRASYRSIQLGHMTDVALAEKQERERVLSEILMSMDVLDEKQKYLDKQVKEAFNALQQKAVPSHGDGILPPELGERKNERRE